MTFKPINLQDILIQNISDQPYRIWDNSPQKVFHDYRVHGYVINKEGKAEEVGHITLSRCCYSAIDYDNDDFWFEKKGKIKTPRVVAVFQDTEESFRGQGVSGELLKLVNTMAKVKFGCSISSDTTFCHSPVYNWKEKNYVERPAKKVWEKLEVEGFAYSHLYRDKPRWVML
ncbi:Uncharacterised protein [uncultured archaeon]|nr:Uncharacterised protein [uncultured archaeon]